LRSVVSEIGEINEVLHLWNIDGECEGFACAPDYFSKAQKLGFYSLIYLARALSDNLPESRVGLWIIADKLLAVESNKVIRPEKATLIGPCRVIPQEYENINAKIIDITVDEAENRSERVIERILAEIEAESEAVTVAYRGNKRWEQVFEHVRLTDGH